MAANGAAMAVVRERVDSDLPRASALLVNVFETDCYPVEGVPDPVAWLTHPAVVKSWVAELNGEIVGHVSVCQPMSVYAAAGIWNGTAEGANDTVLSLVRLFVSSTVRGQALGQRLIEAARRYAKEIGAKLVLDVLEKDQPAVRLYERLGWRRIGEAKYDAGKAGLWTEICFVSPE